MFKSWKVGLDLLCTADSVMRRPPGRFIARAALFLADTQEALSTSAELYRHFHAVLGRDSGSAFSNQALFGAKNKSGTTIGTAF